MTARPVRSARCPHLFKSKCQIAQWPTDAHSLSGLPRKVLYRKRSTGLHFSITSRCTGCQAVSSTSLHAEQ